MHESNRRTFLGATAGVALGSLAGCTSSGQNNSDIKDSDGDGVIDSKDYAPKDANVQKKSDVSTAAKKTSTPSPSTSTPTEAPTTSTTETSTRTTANTVEVDYSVFDDRTEHFREYGLTSAKVRITPETLTNSYPNGARLAIFLMSHPSRETVYGYFESKSFDIQNRPFTATASGSLDDIDVPDKHAYHVALLLPGDETVETASSENVEKLCETNRFTATENKITPDPHPAGLDAAKTDVFSRTVGEGKYILDFSGTTKGQNWSANYVIHKSIYIEKTTAQRGRSRSEYVAVAQQSGFADAMGTILHDEAVRNGFTGKREKAEFAIDFVQNLPYVTDNVSKGFDDYTKFMAETLTEAAGDCEDTSILLASILQSPAFYYDCVLLLLPGHMAVGVYGEDLPGYYFTYEGRNYYYLETTGSGWGVGDVPSEYENEEARISDV